MAKDTGKKLARRQGANSCAQELAPRVNEWRKRLKKALALSPNCSPLEREGAECDLCLSSRSAYFDLYTWVVIHGDLDKDVEQTFHELFQQSASVLTMEQYAESVRKRQQEFNDVCARVKGGQAAGSVSAI